MHPSQLQRREFVTLISGAAAAWPVAVRAQQPSMPVVGVLSSRSAADLERDIAAFRDGLREIGFVDGQNASFSYRYADGRYDRLPVLAAELVRERVAVLFASGGLVSVRAAKDATVSIPIVFTSGFDPVAEGIVNSLNRPGGNITGAYLLNESLDGKRLEILCEAVPSARAVAALINPTNPAFQMNAKNLDEAARALQRQLVIFKAQTESEVDAAFAETAKQRIGAMLVGTDAFLASQFRSQRLAALAAQYRIAVIHSWRAFPEAGGLMSYGTILADAYRVARTYTGRILKGEKPHELPVQQSTKAELVLNLKAAKSLGLTFPLTLLGRADEVIE